MIRRRLLLLTFLLVFFISFSPAGFTQQGATLRGNLDANANFFLRDSVIGAANIPQYDRQLFGADVYFNLSYTYKGFDVGLRFDMFNNSLLFNPTGSYSGQGIGRWYAKKKFNKLGVSVGYLYDQIGSGIIYRAYELRPLFIDQALYGLRLTYDIAPDWQIKAFTGKQKRQFDLYESVLRGGSLEGYISLSDSTNLSIAPGIGVVARTLDDETQDRVITAISTYEKEDQIIPKYNTYAFTLYNTLSAGAFNWYIESAIKSNEAFFDPMAPRQRPGDAAPTFGKLVLRDGLVLYSTLSFAKNGFGATLEVKRTENFDFRTDPQLSLNNGLLNFLPPMARTNTYRLTARYAAVTQFIGEQAFQAELRYAPKRTIQFLLNGSYIDDLNGNLLYREAFAQVLWKKPKKFNLIAGLQRQEYNQEIYFVKPDQPNIKTWVPFADFLYKLDRKKALRFEVQYMIVNEDSKGVKVDYGDWVNGLVEFTFAPHWTITASDMYNISPGKVSPTDENGEKLKIHYPRFDVFYTYKTNRFSLSYVKQVEGIVCTGGICRLEPAFSGVKLGVSSTF